MERKDVIIKAVNFEEGLVDTISDDVLSICESITLMPDTHIGKTVPIGFVGKLKENHIIPEMVGVDIGCGMSYVILDKAKHVNLKDSFDHLYDVIINNVPSGFDVNASGVLFDLINNLTLPICDNQLDRIYKSIGTLGSGNHFIEVNEFDDTYVLVVHSGSRGLGQLVCKYHQRVADKNVYAQSFKLAVEHMKESHPKEKYSELIRELKIQHKKVVLQDKEMLDYINDMSIAQEYAKLNRETILSTICDKWLDMQELDVRSVHHNFYDIQTHTVYKGAIKANLGDDIIIPINMRDGIIIGFGKGNTEWSNACPHGAGRIKSRSMAKESLSVDDMLNQMKDVYSKSVNLNTLDEHPDAYRGIDEILSVIGENVSDIKVGKPIFNYKGAQETSYK